jgi:hypothetical protein
MPATADTNGFRTSARLAAPPYQSGDCRVSKMCMLRVMAHPAMGSAGQGLVRSTSRTSRVAVTAPMGSASVFAAGTARSSATTPPQPYARAVVAQKAHLCGVGPGFAGPHRNSLSARRVSRQVSRGAWSRSAAVKTCPRAAVVPKKASDSLGQSRTQGPARAGTFAVLRFASAWIPCGTTAACPLLSTAAHASPPRGSQTGNTRLCLKELA